MDVPLSMLTALNYQWLQYVNVYCWLLIHVLPMFPLFFTTTTLNLYFWNKYLLNHRCQCYGWAREALPLCMLPSYPIISVAALPSRVHALLFIYT